MLVLMKQTLEDNAIPVVIVDSESMKDNEEAISTFCTSATVRVIMLSMQFAAAVSSSAAHGTDNLRLPLSLACARDHLPVFRMRTSGDSCVCVGVCVCALGH